MSFPKHNVPSGDTSPIPAIETPYPHVVDADHHHNSEAQPPTEGVEAGRNRDEYATRDDSPARDEMMGSTPQPSFRPFFTLVEDAHSAEYHHPTVHYIFADDDTDLVTEAALRSLDPSQQEPNYDESTSEQKQNKDRQKKRNQKDSHDDHYNHPEQQQKHDDERQPFSLPPPIPGTQEHFIILDVEPTSENSRAATTAVSPHPTHEPAADQNTVSTPAPTTTSPTIHDPQNFKITSAHSLSPSWQILDTSLCPAPTFDSSPSNATSSNDDSPVGGLMLKIKGSSGFSKQPSQPQHAQTLEDMMDQFSKRMGDLRRVLETGGDYEEPKETEQGQSQGDHVEKGAQQTQV